MPEPFGEWLRRTRKQKRLTLEKVAERLGTSHVSIQRYESGERNVEFPVALRLADALGVPRSLVTTAWVAAQSGEDVDTVRYVNDPDAAVLVERYEGLDETNRDIARTMIEKLYEAQRGASIGGGDRSKENTGGDVGD